MPNSKGKLCSIALFLLIPLGCGNDDSGDTGETDTGSGVGTDTVQDTGSGGDTAAGPTHDADIQPIFTVNCSPCHITTASGRLSLASAFDKLVNVPSTQATSLDLVEPSDPDKSYLWHKLSGTQTSVGGSGGKMPSGELDADKLDLIEAWITGGAPR